MDIELVNHMLLTPLMVGSISGALLILAAGNFLMEYIKEIDGILKKIILKEPLDELVPTPELDLAAKIFISIIALIFLFSEVPLLIYVVFGYGDMIYAAIPFFTAIVLTIVFILGILLLLVLMYRVSIITTKTIIMRE